eukprot:gene4350-7706_t
MFDKLYDLSYKKLRSYFPTFQNEDSSEEKKKIVKIESEKKTTNFSDYFKWKNDENEKKHDLKIGDHIFVWRYFLYNHHGIYIGNDEIIHFSGEPFKFQESTYIPKITGFVEKTNLQKFLKGGNISIQQYGDKIGMIGIYSSEPEVVLKRANILLKNSKLIDYNLFFNNCEHLAIWCKTGYKFSVQINKLKYAEIYSKKFKILEPSDTLDPSDFIIKKPSNLSKSTE